MKSIQCLVAAIAFATMNAAVGADSTQITDEASAIAAAKRYMTNKGNW